MLFLRVYFRIIFSWCSMEKELEDILKQILIRQHAQAIVTMLHIAGIDKILEGLIIKNYFNIQTRRRQFTNPLNISRVNVIQLY